MVDTSHDTAHDLHARDRAVMFVICECMSLAMLPAFLTTFLHTSMSEHKPRWGMHMVLAEACTEQAFT